jgi:hypothetical protein
MASEKRFFREFTALRLFALGTVVICVVLPSLKAVGKASSDGVLLYVFLWFCFTGVCYLGSFLIWRRSGPWRIKFNPAPEVEPEPTQRNPPAKLPPLGL